MYRYTYGRCRRDICTVQCTPMYTAFQKACRHIRGDRVDPRRSGYTRDKESLDGREENGGDEH